jgi:hypothetical protein
VPQACGDAAAARSCVPSGPCARCALGPLRHSALRQPPGTVPLISVAATSRSPLSGCRVVLRGSARLLQPLVRPLSRPRRNRGGQKPIAFSWQKRKSVLHHWQSPDRPPTGDRLPTRRKLTPPKLTSNRHAQPEMATGIFCLNRPQPFEKSRIEKINDSKRKQICFLLFSFTYFYLQITRAWVECRGFVADRSAACRNIRASA